MSGTAILVAILLQAAPLCEIRLESRPSPGWDYRPELDSEDEDPAVLSMLQRRWPGIRFFLPTHKDDDP